MWRAPPSARASRVRDTAAGGWRAGGRAGWLAGWLAGGLAAGKGAGFGGVVRIWRGGKSRHKGGGLQLLCSAVCSCAQPCVCLPPPPIPGGIKKWGFARGNMTHGSKSKREHGSTGPGSTPGRVFPGLKAAGQMGNIRAKLRKVEVRGCSPACVRQPPALLLLHGCPRLT